MRWEDGISDRTQPDPKIPGKKKKEKEKIKKSFNFSDHFLNDFWKISFIINIKHFEIIIILFLFGH